MIRKYKLFLENITIEEHKNNHLKLIYTEYGKELGYITCYYDDDYLSEFLPNNSKGEFYIDYVTSYVKGKEIGKKLINAAIEEAKKLGLNIITLKLPNDNGRSIETLRDYYKSLGFVTSWTKDESEKSGYVKNVDSLHMFI